MVLLEVIKGMNALDEDQVARMLIKLLEEYTPPGSESKLHETLKSLCGSLGFEECYVDEVGNFFASYGRGDVILLASHLDTVPGKLKVSYDGELVYGRGAVDAKGPLLSYILGAHQAFERVSGVKVIVAGLVREELDGLGAKYLVEKGLKVDHILVGEPTGFGIAVAYRGSVTAEAYARARGGHSSAPYVGESALDRMLGFVNEVRSRFRGSSYDEVTSAITMLRSGDWPSKLPEEARAYVNIRFPSPIEVNSILDEVRGIAGRHGVELRMVDATPPVEVKLSVRAVRALVRGCLRSGVKPRIVKKTGTSDMNVLASLTRSIAAFGPGDSKLAHTSLEKMAVGDLIKAASIVSAAIEELSR